jgi:triosephosphate isomerase
LFLLNLKVYPDALGDNAERLARLLERLSETWGVASAVAPPTPDLARVARSVGFPVLAQHVDPVDPGARTGFVPPESAKESGAAGSLVNHSEHPLPEALVGSAVERLGRLGLTAVVCAKDIPAARRLARFRPPYLAVEPPELIGGTRSVSTARPEIVSGAVAAVRSVSPSTRVLCGAGVHDRNDVRIAIELGASGVLVSSAVARAPDPAAAIEELLSGYSTATHPT